MSDERKWPQEVVDAVNRIGVDYPERCGQNTAGLSLGCGQLLTSDIDRFKFHRSCARKHFTESGDKLQGKLAVYEHQHEIITGELVDLKERLRALHDLVDQTDPRDPIGAALTQVGLERRP